MAYKNKEEQRKANREAAKRYRQKNKKLDEILLIEDEVELEQQNIEISEATASEQNAVPTSEYVMSGYYAGLLEASFVGNMGIMNEVKLTKWLDKHPIGSTIVHELLSSSGFGTDFIRWRGER